VYTDVVPAFVRFVNTQAAVINDRSATERARASLLATLYEGLTLIKFGRAPLTGKSAEGGFRHQIGGSALPWP
jgi:hypothetical protein